jgi:hypothetical protein
MFTETRCQKSLLRSYWEEWLFYLTAFSLVFCFWTSSCVAIRLQASLREVDSTPIELNERLSRARPSVSGLEVVHRLTADRQIFPYDGSNPRSPR